MWILIETQIYIKLEPVKVLNIQKISEDEYTKLLNIQKKKVYFYLE